MSSFQQKILAGGPEQVDALSGIVCERLSNSWNTREIEQLRDMWAGYKSKAEVCCGCGEERIVSDKGQAGQLSTLPIRGKEARPAEIAARPALHLVQKPPNLYPATPAKPTGKCMSRRTGQQGYIEKSGKWWVVRWWMDVEGQDKRSHKRARICPTAGKGILSASARQRRAHEIIVESGADTELYFNRVVKQKNGSTFKEQASFWIEQARSRKRKPVAIATLQSWEGCLGKWINPAIGNLPLSEINNAALKGLVATMAGKLSPKSIDNYAQVVKMVVASAVNKEGEEIHPRKWNHEFIDMPLVIKSKQNTPSFSAEIMSGLASWKYPRERMVFILCGATGLRRRVKIS